MLKIEGEGEHRYKLFLDYLNLDRCPNCEASLEVRVDLPTRTSPYVHVNVYCAAKGAIHFNLDAEYKP